MRFSPSPKLSLLLGALTALPVAVSAVGTTYVWNDSVDNGILFGPTGYNNWTDPLTAAGITTSATARNDFVIGNTTRSTFYISDATASVFIGSMSFTGTLPSLVTIASYSNSTAAGFLRFYNTGTVMSLGTGVTSTVATSSSLSTTGYLGVGLNYTGLGTFNVTESAAVIDLSSTVNNTSGSGGIYGTGGITKTGAGTLIIATADSQDNTYAGGTRILGGTVVIGESGDLGSGAVVISGGTLRHSGTRGVATSASAATRGYSIGAAGGTVSVDSGSAYTIGGVVSDWTNDSAVVEVGTLTKTGAGVLGISGVNTFTGGVNLTAGTVRFVGTAGVLGGAGSSFGITVASGTTLDGTGMVNGNSTVASGGILRPHAYSTGVAVSDVIGTLSFSNDLNIVGAVSAATPSLYFDLGAGSLSDKIVAAGLLSIGNGLLGLSDFSFTAGTGFGAGTYTLLQSGQSIAGSLLSADTTGVIAGYDVSLVLANGGTTIDLIVAPSAVPEPSTWAAIFGAAALTVAIVRRSKTSAA